MEMTLNQKIERVRDLLSGQHSLWNRNVFYIPAQDIPPNITGHFWEILEKFEREGLVKKAYFGYAGLFDAEHIPEVFEKIRENEKIPSVTVEFFEAPKRGEKNPRIAVVKGKYKSKNIELLPTYYIEIDASKLNQTGAFVHSVSKGEVEFDALNGIISFGKIIYAFQKARKGQLRLKLFKALRDERRVIKNGKVKPTGMSLPPGTVASRMDLISSPKDFDKNESIKNELDALIKNVKINLQRKKLPIRIYKKGGIQIVIEVK